MAVRHPLLITRLRQRWPGILITNRAVTSALTNLLLTIPIDTRHCFTQRFSPTGFILNALGSNCCHRIASARIQVKTYPFSSILAILVLLRSDRLSGLGSFIRPQTQARELNSSLTTPSA